MSRRSRTSPPSEALQARARAFQALWNAASSPKELAARLGEPAARLGAKAHWYRGRTGLDFRRFPRNPPDSRARRDYATPYGTVIDEALAIVASHFGVDPARAVGRNDNWLYHAVVQVAVYVAMEHADVPAGAFRHRLGHDASRACRQRRKIAAWAARDGVFAARLRVLGATLRGRLRALPEAA